MEYSLAERTTQFSISVLVYLKKVKLDIFSKEIINQLARSALSVGANYAEANGASSKRDFRNKIHLCKKEVMESEYWLKVLASFDKENAEMNSKLLKEVHELSLIFTRIAKSCATRMKIEN